MQRDATKAGLPVWMPPGMVVPSWLRMSRSKALMTPGGRAASKEERAGKGGTTAAQSRIRGGARMRRQGAEVTSWTTYFERHDWTGARGSGSGTRLQGKGHNRLCMVRQRNEGGVI